MVLTYFNGHTQKNVRVPKLRRKQDRLRSYYAERARKRLTEASYHEAGHYIVSTELKSPAVAFLASTGCQCDTFHPYYGEVSQLFVGTDSFWNGWKGGAIGIAGIVAETLAWDRIRTFEQLHEHAWVNFEDMWHVEQVSQSDDDLLINLRPDCLTRAYEFACKVVWKKRKTSRELRSALERMESIRPTQSGFQRMRLNLARSLGPQRPYSFSVVTRLRMTSLNGWKRCTRSWKNSPGC
jgi:hypothetical protein